MSLRPPLLGSTFQARTVVSMFGRLCHLFVHALCSLQVANAKCMTLRSLASCLRAACEKHRFAAGKKHWNGKNYVWQQEKKRPAAEKSCFCSGEKRQQKMLRSGKNSKQQEKTPCSSKKAPLQQKCILEAAGKNRPRREKTRPREKTRARQENKSAAEKVQLCNPKSRCNGKNIFPQREKAAAQVESAFHRLRYCKDRA